MAFGFGFGMPHIFFGSGAFSPASLFASGAPGVWYDPSDFTTLFQDSAGTTPVTAVEQFVGLMLDKSQGLAQGPELVTNGDFSNGTTGWASSSGFASSAAVVSGEFQVTATAAFGRQIQAITCVVGRTYRVTCVARVVSGTVSALIERTLSTGGGLGPFAATTSTSNVTLSLVFTATATTEYICVGSGAGTTGQVMAFDNISVKELAGNHAFQSTNGSRPVVSARVNLLTKTEDLTNAAWTSTVANSLVTSGVTDPNGGSTAFTITATAPSGQCYQNTSFSAPRIASGWIRRRTGTGTIFFFNDSGAVGQNITSLVTSSWTYFTVSSSTSNGSWYILLATSGDAVDVWHPDVRPSNDTPAPAYQRVNTSTDYDTVGFPVYLKFDGTDDSLVCSSLDRTAWTDAMCVTGGMSISGVGAYVDGLNSSGFSSHEPFSDNNWYCSFGSNIRADSITPLSYRTSYVLTRNRASGTTSFRKNGANTAITAAGITNYGGTSNVFIGRNAGGGFLNGQLYSLIIVSKTVTATELTNTETYVAIETGFTAPVITGVPTIGVTA